MISELSLRAVSGAAGLAVLHFLWQGVVIGALAAAALRVCRRSDAQVRYAVACAALGACALVFTATFLLRLSPALSAAAGPASLEIAGVGSRGLWGVLFRAETVAILWCVGMAVLAFRLWLQLAAARRLTGADVAAPSAEWLEAFEKIKARLGVRGAVCLIQHAAIDSPMVVGWFAPVVLVPVAVFASLTPDQLCAVLAHELAHIRRRDHLVNAVQAVVEVVLFFHPVVWWLSSTVRVEREHCCDDVAVGAAASPLVFAEALARLETLRQVLPQAAVAANGGSLMERIERVLRIDRASSARSLRWKGAAAIAAAAMVAVAALAQVSAQPAATTPPPAGRTPPLLRLVVPTVVTPAGDGQTEQLDDPQVDLWVEGTEQGGKLQDVPIEFQVKLTQEQYDRMMQKKAVERVVKGHNILVRRVDGLKLDEKALDLRKAMDDIEAAVDAGDLTQEEADIRLADLRKQMAETKSRVTLVARLDDNATTERDRAAEAERAELDKIEDQVAAGMITRAEADDRIEVLRKTVAEREARMKLEAEREAQAKEATDRAAHK